MTVFLKLFLVFLEIGAVSFGGGYAMIAMIRDKALLYGWLSEAELLDMIAVAESTPGPIAVNMATFVGASEGGLLGALCATLGVILPSFLIILLIASLIRGFLKLKLVRAALSGIRPCTVGLILATAITMLLSILLGFTTASWGFSPDLRAIAIFILLILFSTLFSKAKKKKPSPILMILISAGLGMLLYSI